MIWALVEARLVRREATSLVRRATWEAMEVTRDLEDGEGASMEASESTQKSTARSESISGGNVFASSCLEREVALVGCFHLAVEEVGLVNKNTGANRFGGIRDRRGEGPIGVAF